MNRNKRIYLSIIFCLIFHSGNIYGNTTQEKLLQFSQEEIGHGEIGKNNSGKYVKLYNKGLEAPWCAGFISYCLEQSGYKEFNYQLSARRIWNIANEKKLIVDIPQAGDLIVFWRESPTSWKGHIGIVSEVGLEAIWTIEGNVGDFPSTVKRIKYNRNDIPRLLGYIRIK